MSQSSDGTIVTCGGCGQRNRVDTGRSADAAVCGRCRRSLEIGKVVEVTDSSYRNEVEASALPVLLDCWAPWCGPCRIVAPVLESLAPRLAGRVKIAKLNVDENPSTAARFNISSIPTMLLVKEGRVSGRIVGAQPEAAILGELERAGFL